MLEPTFWCQKIGILVLALIQFYNIFLTSSMGITKTLGSHEVTKDPTRIKFC